MNLQDWLNDQKAEVFSLEHKHLGVGEFHEEFQGDMDVDIDLDDFQGDIDVDIELSD